MVCWLVSLVVCWSIVGWFVGLVGHNELVGWLAGLLVGLVLSIL
jgi:hypothetical protein